MSSLRLASLARRPLWLPAAIRRTCRCLGIAPTRHVLVATVADQSMVHLVAQRLRVSSVGSVFPLGQWAFTWAGRSLISTSRFGTGQVENSLGTPLGLHRIAEKHGGGWPIGTAFEGRRAVGWTWVDQADAAIAHRILWLEGMEPGHNRGGNVDSFRRYIYLHGLGNEPSLGRPASRGCLHLGAADLIPLCDAVPVGTLVWIDARPLALVFARTWATSGSTQRV